MKKRILSCVLSAALLLGLTPWSALATDDPLTDQTKVQTDFQSPPRTQIFTLTPSPVSRPPRPPRSLRPRR